MGANAAAALETASAAAFLIALIAGVATTDVGLHQTALVYCAAIATLGAVAAASLIFRRRSSAPMPDPPAVQTGPQARARDTEGR